MCAPDACISCARDARVQAMPRRAYHVRIPSAGAQTSQSHFDHRLQHPDAMDCSNGMNFSKLLMHRTEAADPDARNRPDARIFQKLRCMRPARACLDARILRPPPTVMHVYTMMHASME